MKPGKARKDRPKGAKSFSRGSNKRVERSAVARPEKRDNRRDDKLDARKGFRKPVKSNDQAMDGLIKLALEQREAARVRKDFAAADQIRDQIAALGVTVEDTSNGPRWSY